MVNGVHFSESALESSIYGNKRAEMACLLEKWIAQPGVNIPDDDDFHADLMSVPDIKSISDGPIKLVSKEKIKDIYGKSPDIFDAAMLTFAHPVRLKNNKATAIRSKGKNQASWKRAAHG